MKRVLTAFLFLPFFWACSENSTASSETDLDAARNFLNAALAGKWTDARQLVIQDSVNVQLIETAEDRYNGMKNEEKVNYMQAHPILHESRKMGDSVTIVNYSNTYTKKMDSLKIVRQGKEWLIDLKYSLLPSNN